MGAAIFCSEHGRAGACGNLCAPGLCPEGFMYPVSLDSIRLCSTVPFRAARTYPPMFDLVILPWARVDLD